MPVTLASRPETSLSFKKGREGQDVMDRIASRAKVLYAGSEKTAQDYADVVVRRSLERR